MANEGLKRRMSDRGPRGCDKEEPPLLLRVSAETVSFSGPIPKPTKSESESPMPRKSDPLLPLPRRRFFSDGKENSDPRRSNLPIHVVDETALVGSSNVVISKRAPRERPSSKKSKKKVYSRKALEALRFSDVADQRRMWTDVHVGLGPTVRKEYDFLLILANDHRSPSLTGISGWRGRLSEVRI